MTTREFSCSKLCLLPRVSRQHETDNRARLSSMTLLQFLELCQVTGECMQTLVQNRLFIKYRQKRGCKMPYTSILSHAMRIIVATSKYHIASMDAELSAVLWLIVTQLCLLFLIHRKCLLIHVIYSSIFFTRSVLNCQINQNIYPRLCHYSILTWHRLFKSSLSSTYQFYIVNIMDADVLAT